MSNHVLITGASSGIGLELAKIFAGEGYGLVLVAKDSGRLDAAAGELANHYPVPVKTLCADFSLPEAAEHVVRQLRAWNLDVAVLVNNAGFTVYGEFEMTDLGRERERMEVNMAAPVALTKRLIGPMIQKGRGKILNIASTAAFQPGPLMAVYYASKAFVLSFSEALAFELKGRGITVTALCPGPTRTGFQQRGQVRDNILFRYGTMSAEQVARAGFRGLMRGQSVVIPGWINKVAVGGVKFAPRPWVLKTVHWLQK